MRVNPLQALHLLTMWVGEICALRLLCSKDWLTRVIALRSIDLLPSAIRRV